MARRWFKLDNAAKLYPAVSSSSWGSVFRVSAQMDEPIDTERLQRAVDDTVKRFPSMNVRLHKGLFWFYMEESILPLNIREDKGHPCMRFVLNREPLLRVNYFHDRINVEFFHSVTDGTGGLIFLKTLIARYVELKGYKVIYDNGAKALSEKPPREEMEDSFLKMPLPGMKQRATMSKAWHYPVTKEMRHTLHVISAQMNSEAVREKARSYGVTITEYLTAVLLYASYLEQISLGRKKKAPLRVQVPVNMRSVHPSATLRNFSTYVIPEIDPRLGEYTFDETIKNVQNFMRYAVNEKFLKREIAKNVADERSLAVRLVPLFIKNWVVNMVFTQTGDRILTTTLSNLGNITLPTGTESHVKDLEFMLGPTRGGMCNCSALSLNGNLRLTFTRNVIEPTLPRRVLRFLVEQGLQISVRSNKEDE